MTEVKARLETKNGVVELQGEPDAIRQILSDLELTPPTKRREKTLKQSLMELIADGFLDSPKSLGGIRAELAKRGFNYSTNTLFPAIYRGFLREKLILRSGKRKSYQYYANPNQTEKVTQELETLKLLQEASEKKP